MAIVAKKTGILFIYFRVVHGSLFLDSTRRNVDPTQHAIADKTSDPTRPDPTPPICTMFHNFNIKHSSCVFRGWKKLSRVILFLKPTKRLQISNQIKILYCIDVDQNKHSKITKQICKTLKLKFTMSLINIYARDLFEARLIEYSTPNKYINR